MKDVHVDVSRVTSFCKWFDFFFSKLLQVMNIVKFCSQDPRC